MPDITARLSTALADRYQIERRLGEGGMATVYLAQDLKHQRKVAVKVLRPELAAVLGAERFVQEITTTAGLQHPHILPLHDSGEADGFLYYVMPFIDGETLRDKLNRETQLGIEEAVRIASEVADALDYAHRHNVIHRDIKPENILLHDSRPVVADFGIALAVSAAAGGRMTETGLSLGTPHYMSPEQATAEKDLTNRSDIYSLGAMLYEMLTGDPPHTGSSAQQIIMKIVTDDARPVTELRRSVPPNVAAATAKALEKLPADRFESARAFATALSDAGFTVATLPHTTAHRPHRAKGPTAVLGAIAVLSTIVAAWSLLRPAPVAPVRRYRMALPEGQSIHGIWARIAVSPDGSRFAYDARTDGVEGIWVLERSSLDASLLPGTVNAWSPAFSPDGEHLAYYRSGAVATASLRGGTPTTVIDSGVGGATLFWTADGTMYYDSSGTGPIMRIAAAGGAPERVTVRDRARGELDHFYPIVLPEDDGLLFTVRFQQRGVDPEVAILEPGASRHRTLLEHAWQARYVEPGFLLYVSGRDLLAVRFDRRRGQIVGDAATLVEGILWRDQTRDSYTDFPYIDIALTRDGTLFYTTGVQSDRVGEPVWVDRDGDIEPIPSLALTDASEVAISPDGSRVAFSVGVTESNIMVAGPSGPVPSRLTFGESAVRNPLWTDDASSAYFLAEDDRGAGLYRRPIDGTRAAELIADMSMATNTVDVSADGEWVLYSVGLGNNDDVVARKIGDDSLIVVIANSAAPERRPVLSPDGNWVVYESMATGSPEVFIQPFPDASQGSWRVSSAGGVDPVWARDGSELFYLNSRQQIVAVEIRPGTRPPLARETVLFSALEFVKLGKFIAPEPGGRRFLMLRPVERRLDYVELTVVENLPAVLDSLLGR